VGDRRSPSVEGAGKSGGDDDDAIAYAWYDEDEKSAELATLSYLGS
jgi:hypothetical protein